jgi:hypothetical protein
VLNENDSCADLFLVLVLGFGLGCFDGFVCLTDLSDNFGWDLVVKSEDGFCAW